MSCSYAAPGSRKKQSASSSSGNSPGDMQNRIDRLEGLVLSLMTNGPQSSGPAAATRALSMSASTGSMEYPQEVEIDGINGVNGMMKPEGEEAESETDQVAQSLGVLKVENNKSMYYGENHWAAVLQDVSPFAMATLLCGALNSHTDCGSQELLRRAPKTAGGPSAKGSSI